MAETEDKPSYKERLSNAIKWLQEEPTEKATTAGRIFDVKPNSIRATLRRSSFIRRPRGGQNKVLSDAQTEAIKLYCFEQWQVGLGATKQMVFAAITFLKASEEPPKEPPSWRWFQTWLQSNTDLHTIKTKPIAQARIEAHTEKDLEVWFDKYRATLHKYGIKKAKNIHNMDETGARIGCPAGEEIIVPIDVKEVYTPSPENRKSVTILEAISADGREPPPPLIICPGKRIMESWIHDNLKGSEVIALSPTGYTNEAIAIAWLKHFIKHTHAGPTKQWKMLLLDGHITHENPDFVILAHENHIKPFEYPSHLTHVLQPLDVGVFRPWKHYHNKAIQKSIRSLDFEYTISSFFRDLSDIREQALKPHTIRNAFKDSGNWPPSYKAACKKMRQYAKKRKAPEPETELQPSTDDDEPILPRMPSTLFQCESGIDEWVSRTPDDWSSPSKKRFKAWMQGTKIQLSKAQLQEQEHRSLQSRLHEQHKNKLNSRKHINAGGPLEVEDARRTKTLKAKKAKDEAIHKAEKAISKAKKDAKDALHRRGVDARKAERMRKNKILHLQKAGELIPIDLMDPIRDPEKEPTPEELLALEPHPSLVQALQDLQPLPIDPRLLDDDVDDEVDIQVERVQEQVDLGQESEQDEVDEADLEGLVDSDSEGSETSLDSIQRNADFISFED